MRKCKSCVYEVLTRLGQAVHVSSGPTAPGLSHHKLIYGKPSDKIEGAEFPQCPGVSLR